ncbi:hypothetical protein CUC53_04255 [Aeromonas cavernicola]|uniref:Uncharacterized protein n=2 Tax=Aeromonas cavernicola TaxID=1006623 RepID=A0A2H9U7M1_9GAMM|nr:hypothetical protein CUC53_04255 [Aeromonas cavernicola]
MIHANYSLNQRPAPAEIEPIARLCFFCLSLPTIGQFMKTQVERAIVLCIGQQVIEVASGFCTRLL